MGQSAAVRAARSGPVRTCIGCRERDEQSALLRLVARVGDGSGLDKPRVYVVEPDPQRQRPGRGAWLHRASECLELAERRRAFSRALRVQGPADAAPVREYLEQLEG